VHDAASGAEEAAAQRVMLHEMRDGEERLAGALRICMTPPRSRLRRFAAP